MSVHVCNSMTFMEEGCLAEKADSLLWEMHIYCHGTSLLTLSLAVVAELQQITGT